MNKLDRIVMERIKKLSRELANLSAHEFEKNNWWGHDTQLGDLPLDIQKKLSKFADWLTKKVAQASFDETNHFVEKLLDGVEDLIERYVDDARWMSWIKKKRKKWEKLKEGFGVGNG